MFYKTCFLFICVVALIVPAITVEKCFVCEYFDYYESNDTNNEACKESDLSEEEFLKPCNDLSDPGSLPDDWQCSLVRGRIEVDEENFEIVKRSCVPGKLLKAECKNTKSYQTDHGFIKRGSECICDDKDGCNSGSSITFPVITLGLGLVLSQLFKP